MQIDWKNSLLRVWPWMALALVTLALMALLVPHQLPALLWNLGKVSLGVHLGYWADRHLFPYARPHRPVIACNRSTAMIRRAILVAAVVIALGLGV